MTCGILVLVVQIPSGDQNRSALYFRSVLGSEKLAQKIFKKGCLVGGETIMVLQFSENINDES